MPTAEELGMRSFTTEADKGSIVHAAQSPIKRTALSTDCELVKSEAPRPVETFEAGIEAPTFMLLNQPLPELHPTTVPGTSPASPSCAEYIRPGALCTATQQMLKYIRTSDYQAGPIGECQGKVAANSDQTALASYLRANADIDAQDPACDGYTALHHAASSGRVDLIALLIAFGANIDRRDYDGNKAEDIARESAKNAEDDAMRHTILEGMHCLVQGKQAKGRTQRYFDAGHMEYPTSPKTPQHAGVSSGVVS